MVIRRQQQDLTAILLIETPVNVVHLECLLDVSGDPPAIADRFPIVSGFFAS